MLEQYALLKVMTEVLENSASSYSVNETARKANVSPSAAKHSLDYLYGRKMISLDKIGQTYQYKANLDNYLTRQWKIVLTLEDLTKAEVVDRVLKTGKSVLAIILYGSCAIGRDDENSDIDIIVIADTDAKGKREIAGRSTGTSREINISVYTPSEWRRKAEGDKIFYDKVIVDSIAIYGQKPVVL